MEPYNLLPTPLIGLHLDICFFNERHIFHQYQNIFPLANIFAKRENVRLGQSPTGIQMVSINTFFIGAWVCH